jgi:restriction system protein
MTEPKAWLVRGGRYGERNAWALSEGLTPGGFGAVGDLSKCSSKDEVQALVAAATPDDKPRAHLNYANQLWLLQSRVEVGDYVVLPLTAMSQLAIGRVTGPYRYDASEVDPERRHVRPVEWIRTDIPRVVVHQDLLHTLGAFSTYCGVWRNDAAARVAALVSTGKDPGASGLMSLPTSPAAEDLADEAQVVTDVEQYANDRLMSMIQERFAGHKMQALVEAVLEAQGFTCANTPEGTDGGIDILAGSGPLGLDEPRLVVQVKSEQSGVGDPVVGQLLGSVSKYAPAQGLLVAWGGLTPPAKRTARDHYFKLRVWTAADLVAHIMEHYTKLPEGIRAELPLKQIWIPVEEQS